MMKKWRRHRVAVCFMSRRNAVTAPFGSIAKKVLSRYFFYVDIIDFCARWVYTEKIAAIGLLVIYCLKDVSASSTHGLPEAIAIVFIVLLHKWKKSTLLSIGGGTVLYMVLIQTVFR